MARCCCKSLKKRSCSLNLNCRFGHGWWSRVVDWCRQGWPARRLKVNKTN
jgi:hypothetical protein